jgi:anthranilate phosphoribosyltransferase
VASGTVCTEWIDPAHLGLSPATFAQMEAQDVDHAALMVREALEDGTGPVRDIVALNAAAALLVGGAADSLEEGLRLARRAVASGAAAATLENLVRLSNPAPPV